MPDTDPLPSALHGVPLDEIVRIDAAIEGAWSETVVPVWTRADGFLGFGAVRRRSEHPERRPALELYFPGYWIGVHCCRREGREGSVFVFDEGRARDVIDYVEARLGRAAGR